MFNTIRDPTVPSCLMHKKYNTEEVVKILEPMFFGKCYLCEKDELSDPEIEHFDPHESNNSKKYDWHNLYYACGRCNSIKSNIHRNLLDCCDSTLDVFKRIKCLLPSVPDHPISVVPMIDPIDIKTANTVKLLERCYNEDNTALRGITRTALIEKLFSHYLEYLTYRSKLINKNYSTDEKSLARGRLIAMMKVEFPFSVFWRWHLISDARLSNELKTEIDFYDIH